MSKTRTHRPLDTSFASVCPPSLTKGARTGPTKAELDAVIRRLTGDYDDAVAKHFGAGTTFAHFFAEARINPGTAKITGVVCGERAETLEDPLMKQIRWLDKLVDELAKGRPLEKILRD